MKKLFIAAVAVLGLGTVSAQEEVAGFSKGDVFVTGAFTFGSTSQGDNSSTSFEIAPQVGYFVTENIAIGARLGYMSSEEEMGDETVESSGFGVGAFGRYYFKPASQFSLFAELGADYQSMEVAKDVNINGFGAGLGLGLNYFVSKNFSIEAGVAVLGFNSTKLDVEGADAQNTFVFGGDWRAVTFGVNYKF